MTALLLLWACDGGGPPPPPPSRVDAVLAAPVQEASVGDFCEQHPPADEAVGFSWPEMDCPPPAASTGWTWVNVWATWCGPCVGEMPMLVQWRERLQAEGVNADLHFLSVDDSVDVITRWEADHPGFPPTLRFASTSTLEAWVALLGLDAGAVLPIHLFVDPQGRIRCSRMGAVSDADYTVVKKVLSGG